ncbi:hypothetical protein L0P42_16415, partial [Fusicatenibacter saccharivorans]|uniref:hypothetical protein n=1 Tax=Fusicatenibacter saccharivorans TaxID=1150298 RepID=UPI001EDF273E
CFLTFFINSSKYLSDINASIIMPGSTIENLISVTHNILNELAFIAIMKVFIVYPIDKPFTAKIIKAIGAKI